MANSASVCSTSAPAYWSASRWFGWERRPQSCFLELFRYRNSATESVSLLGLRLGDDKIFLLGDLPLKKNLFFVAAFCVVCIYEHFQRDLSHAPLCGLSFPQGPHNRQRE